MKKIVSLALYPLSICLTALIVGVFFIWFTQKKKIGNIIVTIGVVVLILFSFGFLSNTLLSSLENQYSPLADLKEIHGVKWIVVLGGGHVSDPKYPANEQLSGSSLSRLVEGIRIHNSLKGSKLILSGGAVFDPIPEAKVMADAAFKLGVNPEDIILELASKDTEDQAQNIRKLLHFNPNDKFVLVTTASHMPRSITLFKAHGMWPIAAPVGFLVKNPRGMNPFRYFPNSSNIRNMERVFHEYLGLAWTKLKSKATGVGE